MTQSEFFWIPYELFLNFFQAFLFTWFPDRLLTKKKKERVSFCFCIFLTFLGYSVFSYFEHNSIDIAFSSAWVKLIPALYIVFFYSDCLWSKALWIITLFIAPSAIIAFSYYSFAAIFNQAFEWFLRPGTGRLLFTLIGNLILFLTFFLIVRFFSDLKGKGPVKPQSVLFLILIDAAACLSSELMYELYPEGDLTNHVFFLVSLISLVICLASLFLYRSLILYSEEEAELSYIRGQKNAIDSRLAEISEMYSMMQLLNHDIRKHMQVTEELLSVHEIEAGRAYLAEVSDNLENLFSTGCLPLDSALTVRKKLLEEKNIAFLYELCDLRVLPLPSADFCAIIMNLLDNAVEASERYYEETSEHFVRLSIRRQVDMLFIEIVNPCPSRPLPKKNNRFTSQKGENGHGLGLLMVEHIVSSIKGVCKFSQDGTYFRAYAAMPYFEESE